MLAFTTTFLNRLVRVFARSILLQRGPMRCTDLVRAMGLDPRDHKGSIHAVLVDLENERVLGSTRNTSTGKRDLWFVRGANLRKRDRIAAAILG